MDYMNLYDPTSLNTIKSPGTYTKSSINQLKELINKYRPFIHATITNFYWQEAQHQFDEAKPTYRPLESEVIRYILPE